MLRGVAGMATGALLTVWGLFGAGVLPAGERMTEPGVSPTGPVVRNGVSIIVACGKKSGITGMGVLKYAPESGSGAWDPVVRDECTVWYHHPSGADE